MTTEKTFTIFLPDDARSPFIENGNELWWYTMRESSDYDSRKIDVGGNWKIKSWDEKNQIVVLSKNLDNPKN